MSRRRDKKHEKARTEVHMKKQLGSLYVILSAVLFGTMPLLAKVAYAHGSNAYTVAFSRFLLGSAILGLVTVILPGCSVKVSRRQLLEVFKLSVAYALMPIMLYTSYNYIGGGLATTLHFTYPVAVIVIMAVFCKRKPDAKQVVCTVLCLAGLVLLSTPDSHPSAAGIALAVGSGIVYAVYIVLLGKSTARELHPLTLAFWMSLFAAAEIGAAALAAGELQLSLDGTGWAAEVAMALGATVFALVLFQKGLFLCGEVKASLLSTFEPLTGIVIGVIVFHEALTVGEGMGIVLILAAAVLLVLPTDGIKNKMKK